MVPPHNVPPSQNPTAPANGALHHEAVLEEEPNYRSLTRTQYRPRERIPSRDALRGPREDLTDLEDNYLLAANLINAPLPKFKVTFLERYDGSGYPDDHLQNYRTAMRLHGATEVLHCLTFPTTL